MEGQQGGRRGSSSETFTLSLSVPLSLKKATLDLSGEQATTHLSQSLLPREGEL